VIDVVAGTVVGSISVGSEPSGAAFTPCVEVVARVGADGRTVTVTGARFAPANVLEVSIASTPTASDR